MIRRTICVDAGHGDGDRGGRSLGTDEAALVLRYAILLGKRLKELGHRVLHTRDRDVFVPLSTRARIANEANADLFVSVHANASEHPGARGPWTLHAAGSEKGEAVARVVQRSLARILGGREDAVYPDASGWTGDRRLAVLRQTRMPAVLLELGFMTNAEDLSQLEDPAVCGRVCDAVAEAIHIHFGGDMEEDAVIPPVTPQVVEDLPSGPPMHLNPIAVPTREHVEAAVVATGTDPSLLCRASGPLLTLLDGVIAGNEGPRAALAAELLGALGGFRDRRCGGR